MPWLRRYEIAERSMSPTLSPGDYVVAVAARRPPRRGDVVIFADPELPGRDLVKRVIGLSGETVTVTDGRVLVNGHPEADRWARGPTTPDGSWLVPAGHVFVLGDDRVSSSGDSRATGPTLVESLAWRILFRYGRRSRSDAG
ncbi:MAG: signal peptidase I [Acidimicrobiia bacterium]